MPDNIKVLAGTGDDTVAPPVATDLIGGQHYQRIKIGWGAEGTWNETDDATGARVPVEVSESALIGIVTETAPASDTASAGLNGRLQRIAQRLSSLIALVPTSLGASGGLKVDGSGTALPVSGTFWQATQPVSGTFWQATQPVSGTVTSNAGTNLNTSLLVLEANEATRLGIVTETAPASDTASSGLNGRLQRIAQRLSTLIATQPASLGQTTMAASFPVTVASNQSALPVSGTFWQATQPVSGTFWQATQPVSGTVAVSGTPAVTQSGTWTVQPGNTANTTAWKVDGSAVTQPVSGTVTTTIPANAAATAVDAGDEAATDEAIVGAAANTRLVGFSARETTGTAGAVFNIRHGTSNAGALLVTVSLGTNESAREWYGPDGIAAASGLWLERVSGQTSFVGYYKVAS